MFRGYRGIILALAGIVLGSQAPCAERVASPTPPPKEQPYQSANSSPREPAPIAVRIVEGPEQAKSAERREAESRAHDAKDLDAQIRAADAAEKQIFPSWLGAILSFIGTCLIVWTLCETRESTRIARQQLELQIQFQRGFAAGIWGIIAKQDDALKIELFAGGGGESEIYTQSVEWSILPDSKPPKKFANFQEVVKVIPHNQSGPLAKLPISKEDAAIGNFVGGVLNYMTAGKMFKFYFCQEIVERHPTAVETCAFELRNSRGPGWPENT